MCQGLATVAELVFIVVAYLLLCIGCNIYAAELLNKKERRTDVSHEALIMHSHNCFVSVFVGVICFTV